jgi:protein gp37
MLLEGARMSTRIEWCDETWNPIHTKDGGYHCTKISPGCDHCWAEIFNNRFGNHKPYDASVPDYVMNEEVLHQLFHWRKPRRIFIQSMGDLGLIGETNPGVVNRLIAVLSQSVAYAQHHTFIILTKRLAAFYQLMEKVPEFIRKEIGPHVEIGVTAEDQKRADERISDLFLFRDLFKGVKLFVSMEPMLGEIDISYPTRLDGIILGGETGKQARSMSPAWARSVRDDCIATGTPFFFKGWGAHLPKMDDIYGDPGSPEAGEFMPIDVLMNRFRRCIDGREWNQLAGSKP